MLVDLKLTQEGVSSVKLLKVLDDDKTKGQKGTLWAVEAEDRRKVGVGGFVSVSKLLFFSRPVNKNESITQKMLENK